MAEIDSPIFDYLRSIPEGPAKVAISHLYEIIRQLRDRTGGDVDVIQNIEVFQVTEDGGNRSNRFLIDRVSELENVASEAKRQNRQMMQMVHDLSETIGHQRRQLRLAEQKINELTERYDSGS